MKALRLSDSVIHTKTISADTDYRD